jgi:cell division septum initiation protein DivIVA
MTVTTEQVKGKRFATVRKDGYDPEAVDRQLDTVDQVVRDLAAKCAGLEDANITMRAALVTENERVRVLEDELTRLREEARVAAVVPTPVPVVEDAATGASRAATRLLEMATRDAEAVVVDARDEAQQALATARAEAAEIIQSALGKVHAREEALEAMAAEQRDELDRKRAEADRQLADRRAELDKLAGYETEIRSHLVAYFKDQLDVLDRPAYGETVVGVVTTHPQAS